MHIYVHTCIHAYADSHTLTAYSPTPHQPLLALVMMPNVVQGHRDSDHTGEDEEQSHELCQWHARKYVEPPQLNSKYGSDHICN